MVRNSHSDRGKRYFSNPKRPECLYAQLNLNSVNNVSTFPRAKAVGISKLPLRSAKMKNQYSYASNPLIRLPGDGREKLHILQN